MLKLLGIGTLLVSVVLSIMEEAIVLAEEPHAKNCGADHETSELPGPNRWWFLSPWQGFTGKAASSSMERVSIQLANLNGKTLEPMSVRTTLCVPRAYIGDVAQPARSVHSYVTLVVYLPDYLPRFLAEKAGFQTQGEIVNGIQLRSEAEMIITLKQSGSIKKFIEWIQGDRIFGGTYLDKFNVYYNVKQNSATSPRVPRLESGYLVPISEDETIITFLKNGRMEIPFGIMQFNYRELGIDVSFAGEDLTKYQEVRNRTTELVKSFISN
jgi:hypothetical protein